MKIKYKDFEISTVLDYLLLVTYLDKSDQFHIHYSKVGIRYAPLSTNINKLPQRIKDTKNVLEKKLLEFHKVGSTKFIPTIEEFLVFLKLEERDNRLVELGIV